MKRHIDLLMSAVQSRKEKTPTNPKKPFGWNVREKY
jgi:hypothetical protein